MGQLQLFVDDEGWTESPIGWSLLSVICTGKALKKRGALVWMFVVCEGS